jgi:hypothetical protein
MERLKMLVIKVELWPGGYEGMKRTLAKAHVGNVSNLATVSDYVVSVSEGANPITETPAWTARGRIDGHDRQQSVWALVAKTAAWAAAEAEKRRA